MGTLPVLASRNGLHYPNSWPPVPDLNVPTPLGAIPVGNAANGLCGGMSFAVRDLFEARRLPPDSGGNPEPGSPAFRYLVARLLDSFSLPTGVLQFYAWMNLPTHDLWFGPRGTSWRTIRQELPKLRATIDGGHPCPLGLVQTHSSNPNDLGRNHQVLAYGYEDSGARTTLQIYDPNHPDDDGVTITFETGRPSATTGFVHSRRSTPPVLGFFVEPYTARDPAPLTSATAAPVQ
jgi:hypothetical protein